MTSARNILASAILAIGLSATVAMPANAACPTLPPVPAPAMAAEVEAWLEIGANVLVCMEEEFTASRDKLGNQEKAQLVAQMNSLTYQLNQVRLDAQAASRRTNIPQMAALPVLMGR